MPRVAYVNGQYQRLADSFVQIEDRGYQFADAVYEVCLVVDGKYWDDEGHLARLDRSLESLSIDRPMSAAALQSVMRTLVRKNRLRNALVYMQVSRGVAPRNHPFPESRISPSLVLTARPFDLEANTRQAERGVSVITAPDIRWGRVDIKTVGLLPNVLAKQAARAKGAIEAWLVRDGRITEGSSSNAWIVNRQGDLITHPLNNEILGGITRDTVLKCARDLQIKVVERAFSLEEAREASEAFITSAANLVMPVVKLDAGPIGEGRPGPLTKRLRTAYLEKCSADGEPERRLKLL